ncbi:very-short-patch-repair endonuclease [Rhizobium sp. PP-F2F-G36]|nr:very-short-patch-repair endonuclease [Rhizobium sp. PP-F2F-G36]
MRGSNEKRTERARALRQVDNDAERLLWRELRGRRLNGLKFVRQLPIDRYFADFACRDVRLVVEVDGHQHAGSDYDRVRNAHMAANGWNVARFWNSHVLHEMRSVLETIVAIAEGRLTEPVASTDLTLVLAS